MKIIKDCALLASIPLALITTPALSCAPIDSTYMGSICATAANFCPQGYAPADGRLLPIADNQALFSLLGDSYGGDARTTFGLPDLRGRSAIGMGQGPGLTPVIRGQSRGTETVVQTTPQLASHTHSATSTGEDIQVSLTAKQATGVNSPENGYFLGAGGSGPASANMYVAPSTSATEVLLGGVSVSGGTTGIVLSNTGSSQAQTNIPPQMVVNYCIALQGLYPPRP